MPITINPTEEAVAASVRECAVTDSAKRAITLRKPSILSQYRIMETVGSTTAANATYMAMVLPILFVTAIDGDHVPFPTSKMQLEALIQRLDEHGIDAVMQGVREHFGATDPAAEADALKKSVGAASSETLSG